MKQYYKIKAVHPDAILLFRVGDFYETFGEDAITSSSILGITLTRRANGAASYVELAGFPYHAIDVYLPKLVRAGKRVAICEQLEDPKTVKGLVKRGVIELVTPGVVLGDNILPNKENSFLASVFFGDKATGVAFLDISTGEFYMAQGDDHYVDKLMSSLAAATSASTRLSGTDTIPTVSTTGSSRRISTTTNCANSSAPSRSRVSVSSRSRRASPPPEPYSIILSLPSIRRYRTYRPSRASTRTNTYGSTSSRYAIWSSSRRTAPSTNTALPTSWTARVHPWAAVCSKGG